MKLINFAAFITMLSLVQCQGNNLESRLSADDLPPEEECGDLPRISSLGSCQPSDCGNDQVTFSCANGVTFRTSEPNCRDRNSWRLVEKEKRLTCVQACGGISECCAFCDKPEYWCAPGCLTPAQAAAQRNRACCDKCWELFLTCVANWVDPTGRMKNPCPGAYSSCDGGCGGICNPGK